MRRYRDYGVQLFMDDSTILSRAELVTNSFSKKILLVDDVELACKVVALHLRSAGFQTVKYESDPRVVLDLIEEFRPDMILLDIFMPHISGLELLMKIRANSDYDNIIVLMLSSAGADEKYESLELGALGFIQKPITPVNLVQSITNKFAVAQRLGIQ